MVVFGRAHVPVFVRHALSLSLSNSFSLILSLFLSFSFSPSLLLSFSLLLLSTVGTETGTVHDSCEFLIPFPSTLWCSVLRARFQ